jgi:alpha-amylase
MFLSLVFHNHQPVGQLPWAFADAWHDSYAPFLEALEAHPRVRVALHYTGPLLDWLEEHQPATIVKVRTLVARGQVEVLSGGEAEPILAIWPREDQIEQLQRLNARVEILFGITPRGAWLAERVWESHLPAPLTIAGLEYTFVDSTVFDEAHVSEQNASFTAREGEDIVRVFPIDQTLRHRIPWNAPERSLKYLRELHERDAHALAVFADDGEKFGAWPGTFDYVFGEGWSPGGWLDDFFTALEENSEWLETVLPGDYVSRFEARGEVALPSGSYSEMQGWSGGNWRLFLDRYPEARDMFDETMRIRRLVQDAPKALRERARPHILRAQSNDALWHGVFGGLYLRHLRQAIYEECATAQCIIDGNEPFARAGHDNDAHIVETEQQRIGARGGQIFLWTCKRACHNLLSTLRRSRESYHDANAPSDWHGRGALIDHFFGPDVTPEAFGSGTYAEEGDFAAEAWHIETGCGRGVDAEGASFSQARVRLARDGNVWHKGALCPLHIEKEIELHAASGETIVRYRFTNTGNATLDLRWGCEWNLALTGAQLPERHYHADDHAEKLSLEKIARFDAVRNPIAADTWRKLWFEWQFNEDVEMWHVPIETTSQKEGGHIELTHQSSAFVFLRDLVLEPHATQAFGWKTQLTTE